MEDITMIIERDRWSRFVAPTFAGAMAGVCLQNGPRRVDAHAQAYLPTAGTAGMVTGHRPWSPPIT